MPITKIVLHWDSGEQAEIREECDWVLAAKIGSEVVFSLRTNPAMGAYLLKRAEIAVMDMIVKDMSRPRDTIAIPPEPAPPVEPGMDA